MELNQPSFKPYRPSLLWSLLWLVLDVYVFAMGGIAVFCILYVLFSCLPQALWHRRNPDRRRLHLLRALIFGLTAALILLLVTLNNRIRDANAQHIIDAVERFRRERPLYPDSLQQLVPLYLDQVPRANYTLMGQGFRYAGDAEDPRLAYLTAMPYRGRFYRFATRQWEEFD